MHPSIDAPVPPGVKPADIHVNCRRLRVPHTFAPTMLMPRRPRRQGDRGVSMVEFALASIVFFALFFGVVNGAWYLFARNAVTNAARDGARAGIVASTLCDPTTVASAAKSNAGPFSNAIGITPSSGIDVGVGQYCTVNVQYSYAPLAGLFGFGKSTIQSTSKEYQN